MGFLSFYFFLSFFELVCKALTVLRVVLLGFQVILQGVDGLVKVAQHHLPQHGRVACQNTMTEGQKGGVDQFARKVVLFDFLLALILFIFGGDGLFNDQIDDGSQDVGESGCDGTGNVILTGGQFATEQVQILVGRPTAVGAPFVRCRRYAANEQVEFFQYRLQLCGPLLSLIHI